MMNKWFLNAQEASPVVIDLGYLNDSGARARADKIMKCVGKSNLKIVGFNRIVVRIPPTKAPKVLRRFRKINTAGRAPGYCWCTHTWLGAVGKTNHEKETT
jgi:hypothetical protein